VSGFYRSHFVILTYKYFYSKLNFAFLFDLGDKKFFLNQKSNYVILFIQKEALPIDGLPDKNVKLK
jgi:hypothetical protein